eukprot:534574-Hanusia_phi.AAC.4
MIIHVQENRLIEYANIGPILNYDINKVNNNNEKFIIEPFSFDVSQFFTKNFDLPIEGAVTDAYLVSSTYNRLFPKVVPRAGIFNGRKYSGDLSYLATIENNMMTVYPDSRNYMYAIEVSFWLQGYSDIEWQLTGNKFIVVEGNNILIDESYNNLINIPKSINLYDFYNVKTITSKDYTILSDPYSNISITGGNAMLSPDCRGNVGITEGYVFYKNKYWYGSKASYDVVLRFKNSLAVDFKITELAPFHIDLLFPGISQHRTFADRTYATIDTIRPYLNANIDDVFVFDCNLQEVKTTFDIGASRSPIDGEIREPFTLSEDGKLTVYPDYRNKTYDIKISAYLSQYPEKYITQYYSTYIFQDLLTFSSNDDKGYKNKETLGIGYYYIDGDNLFITPYARKTSYTITITAQHIAYNNFNADLSVIVSETRFIDFKDDIAPVNIPFYVLDSKPTSLKGIEQGIDISSYFLKLYPDSNIDGRIYNAYLVADNDIRPRDGIYNKQYSDGTFEYLGNIKDNILTIYPDYRGVRSSHYPINGEIRQQVYLDSFDGSLTIYPDFRNDEYTFEVKAYLEKYPEKYVSVVYNVKEGPIVPIVNSVDRIQNIGLLVDEIKINLQEQYVKYPYWNHLTFEIVCNLENPDALYTLDGSNLYITPYARGSAYDLTVIAYDTAFGHSNEQLVVSVAEIRYLDFRDDVLPTMVPAGLDLSNVEHSFDLSAYYLLLIFPMYWSLASCYLFFSYILHKKYHIP